MAFEPAEERRQHLPFLVGPAHLRGHGLVIAVLEADRALVAFVVPLGRVRRLAARAAERSVVVLADIGGHPERRRGAGARRVMVRFVDFGDFRRIRYAITGVAAER